MKKSFDTNAQLAIFWVWQIFFSLILPVLSGFVLWRYFGFGDFGVGFLPQLFIHLCMVIILGGFWIWWILFWGTWDEGYVFMMHEKYYALPANENVTVEIIIPDGFDYDTHNMISYFFFFKNSFRSHDVTRANIYKYGKWHSQLTFDLVIQHGVLKIYSTFPRKKYTQFVEGIIRLFPGLIINLVQDPYQNWPQEWLSGNKIGSASEFAGYSFGLRSAGFNPIFKATGLPKKPSWSSTDNLLRALKESINEEETIVLQYSFMASPNELPNEQYIKDYDKWRQKLYNFYSPNRNGTKEGEVLDTMLPEKEKKKNEAYHWRANQTLVQTSIRIGAFCSPNRLGFMENILDKLGDVFSGDNARNGSQRPEKKHITATSQKYFRHVNRAPEYQYLYDRYLYPSEDSQTVLDQMAGPIYEKYYFPNENKWRKKVNYKCLIKRDIEAPWDGFHFYSDPVGGAGMFQFPVSAYNPNSYYEANIEGPPVTLYDKVYEPEEGDE